MRSILGAPLPIRRISIEARSDCWRMSKKLIYYKGYLYLPHYYMWLRKHNHLLLHKSKLVGICNTDGCVNPLHYKLVKGHEEYAIKIGDARSYVNESDEAVTNRLIDYLLHTEWE